MAALHYNVETEKALQILYGKTVEKALMEGNAEGLINIQNIPGFIELIDHYLWENLNDWVEKEPSLIANAALALKGIEEVFDEFSRIRLWKLFFKPTLRITQWGELNPSIGKGMTAILQHSTNEYEKIAETILKSFSKTPFPTIEKIGDVDIEKAESWNKCLIPFIEELHKKNHSEIINMHFRLKDDVDLEFLIEEICLLSEIPNSTEIGKYFVSLTEPSNIETQFVGICNGGKFSDRHLNGIKLIDYMSEDFNWNQLIPAIYNRFQANKSLEVTEIVGVSTALFYFSKSGDKNQAANYLRQLISGGHIFHFLFAGFNAKNPDATAACILPILKFPEGIKNHVGNSQRGYQNYKEILESPEKYKEYIKALIQLIIENIELEEVIGIKESTPENEKLVKFILGSIVSDRDKRKFISVEKFVENFEELKNLFPKEDLETLINYFVNENNIINTLTEKPFSVSWGDLYLIVFESGEGFKYPFYLEFLKTGIQSISKNEWIKELKKEGPFVQLVIKISEIPYNLDLSFNLSDALFEHSKEILAGNITLLNNIDKWPLIVDALTQSGKETFLRNLRDKLISDNRARGINFILEIYGHSLISSGVLREKKDEMVRHVFNGILDSENLEGLNWLEKIFREDKKVFDECPKGTKENFKERIQSLLRNDESTSDELVVHIKNLAESIGIFVEEKIKEENNDKKKE